MTGEANIPTSVIFSDTSTDIDGPPRFFTANNDALKNWRQFFIKARLEIDSHHGLLARTTSATDVLTPLYYFQFQSSGVPASSGSSKIADKIIADSFYRDIDEQLNELQAFAEKDLTRAPVEPGALVTAKAIVSELRAKSVAPPAISWHGGDAVVMLWAIGGMTYAVTITDSEYGYVIRQNRKTIKSAHSISVDVNNLQIDSTRLLDVS